MGNIIAVMSADEKGVKIFGYGTQIPDEVPEEAVGFMAEILCKNKIKNPTILLDNGKKVYGCECWWGNAEKFKEKYKNIPITEVDIDEVRKQIRSENEKKDS